MGSLSGMCRPPIVAAAAVAAVSLSTDFRDKFQISSSTDIKSTIEQSNSVPNLIEETKSSWVSNISLSKYIASIRVPTPNIGFAKPVAYTQRAPPSKSSHEALYRWHLPKAVDLMNGSDCSLVKSKTVVVLLGWLGSKQKHLNRYADWYTSRGYHVITFTFPMADLISYQVAGKSEQHIETLVNKLTDWLKEENGKNLVFHTFSNTGWLTYGVILEKLQGEDLSLVSRIKGCVVDSAPVAAPDPQVWASGFSAAFLKKQSVATKGVIIANDTETNLSVGLQDVAEPKPAVTEAALLLVLEKFFEVVLNLPTINRRLCDVMKLLKSGQPSCPQLYIYSSADRVIPAKSVESFIEEQRRSGHEVRACNFVSTPHVDHFRNDPKLYTSQLTNFLDDSVLASCKKSS